MRSQSLKIGFLLESNNQMSFVQKLKIKAGAIAVINSPKEIFGEFKDFKPESSIPPGTKERFDFVLVFAKDSKELAPSWKRIIPALKQDSVFWVAYPKKSSGIPSDLGMSGDGWSVRVGSPWQPVAAVSINDTWTPKLEKERKNRPSEEIHDGDGTLVVDRINRIIQPPKDFAVVLAKHPEAKAIFDALSFTNRKEYVLWIVEAKKSETRAVRVTSAVEKIVSGKKNPSEK